MTNAELIKALRRCSYMTVAGAYREDDYCKPCAYHTEDSADVTCIARMMIDAADALEAADKRVNEMTTKCSQLQAEVDNYEKRIAELEAQMPKCGEWILGKELSRGYIGNSCIEITYEDFRCSVCGVVVEESKKPKWKYCPNCGAIMKTVTDCHTLEEGER